MAAPRSAGAAQAGNNAAVCLVQQGVVHAGSTRGCLLQHGRLVQLQPESRLSTVMRGWLPLPRKDLGPGSPPRLQARASGPATPTLALRLRSAYWRLNTLTSVLAPTRARPLCTNLPTPIQPRPLA